MQVPPQFERTVVFCFHDVVALRNPEKRKKRLHRYAVTLEDFREILSVLRAYRVTSLADWVWMKNPEDTRPRIVLTFDDGYKAHRDIVLPELEERGYGATFFFYADQLKADRKWTAIAKKKASLFEYGSHSWSHQLMRDISNDENFRELFLAREFMADSLLQPTPAFAWPYGYYEAAGVAAAKRAGFAYQVSVDYRIAKRADVDRVIPRYTIFGMNAVKQVNGILADYRKALERPAER